MDNLDRNPPHGDRENLGYLWAAADNFAQTCAKTQNETGAVINTPFAARDVVSVATALGEKDKIRYWGMLASHIFRVPLLTLCFVQDFPTVPR